MKLPGRILFALFSLTIFLSAFLLFLIQPLIAKYILPYFGGTSAVWTTSLLIFQFLLLAGYIYSFLLTKLTPKKQLPIHAAITIVILITTVYLASKWQTAITPPISTQNKHTSEIMQVIILLITSIGLQYTLLSTTSTLLQKWVKTINDTKSAYSLYALSNTGSLLGLIAYPFIFEPLFGVMTQSHIWTACFILYTMLLLVITASTKNNTAITTETKVIDQKTSMKTIILWLLAGSIPTLTLGAVNNHLTQAVASVPLLWLIPLTLYLLSFILVFKNSRIVHPGLWGSIGIITSVIIFYLQAYNTRIAFIPTIILYNLVLFSTAILCHKYAYDSRPQEAKIPIFYLILSLGGVIGSFIVAVIAPLIFSNFYEIYLAIITTYCVSLIWIYKTSKKEPAILQKAHLKTHELTAIIFIATLIFILYHPVNRLLENKNKHISSAKDIVQLRNFYGVIEVKDDKFLDKDIRILNHGNIIHGIQYKNNEFQMKPLGYYGPKSGVSYVFNNHPNRRENKPLNVGIIGLGTGAQSAYAKAGDHFTFYEIDPQMVEVAQKYFTYLKSSPAKNSIIIGDGRLSLEKEITQKNIPPYDILFIDAFSDDSIPVHLLTIEAFHDYFNRLEPKNGLLAVHISNTYLDLQPIIKKAALQTGAEYAFIESEPEKNSASGWQFKTLWAIVSKNKELIKNTDIWENRSQKEVKETKLWTDNYTNLLDVIRR